MSQNQANVSRRKLFAGATTVGAVAAVATVLPGVQPTVQEDAQPQRKPERGGGYHLSEHVKRYFQTTRI
ncbi:MAG: formate dehydrogenase [Hylemonella sp.]